MIVGRVSTASLIGKVMRDFRINEEDFVFDAVEWAHEAMLLIGSQSLLTETGAYLTIENYKAVLPPRVHHILQVLYSPLYDGGEYQPTDIVFPLLPDSSTYHRGLHHPSASNERGDYDHRYKINGSYIHTTFEEGTIYLIYSTIEVGQDGYPVMPDHPSWSTAITWYIIHRLLLSGRKLPAEIKLEYAEMRWLKYCTIARHAGQMPTPDQMESFARNWVTLYQDKDRWSNFFQDRSKNVRPYLNPEDFRRIE